MAANCCFAHSTLLCNWRSNLFPKSKLNKTDHCRLYCVVWTCWRNTLRKQNLENKRNGLVYIKGKRNARIG